MQLSHAQIKKEMNSALAEIEQAANEITNLGSRRLCKLSNTFVLLTCLGFVPSAMANISYLEEPKTAFVFCVTVLAMSSAYGLYYIVQYCLMPELFRSIVAGLVRSVDISDDDGDFREEEMKKERDEDRQKQQQQQRLKDTSLQRSLTMDLLRETQATAKEANKTFESLFQRRHYVDSAFQILIGIVSFALIILILVGPKTDEFGWPGLAEIIFTIWIFFANIVFALVYAFISTQRRKKDLEAAEKTAQKVANDWFISAHRTEYAHLWQQIAEQQKNKSSIVT